MAHSHSHRLISPTRQVLPAFKKNTKLQAVILALSILVILLYGFLLSYQLSAMLYAVNINTELVKTDTELEEVADFEITDDYAIITLFNGDIVNRKDVDFAFYENNGSDEVFYSSESNMLIKELDKGYPTKFLLGSNYFVVLGAVFASLILLFVIRKREWTVYSTRTARVLWTGVFLALAFVGLCTYAVL